MSASIVFRIVASFKKTVGVIFSAFSRNISNELDINDLVMHLRVTFL